MPFVVSTSRAALRDLWHSMVFSTESLMGSCVSGSITLWRWLCWWCLEVMISSLYCCLHFFFFCRIECLVLCFHWNLRVSYHVWQNHWVKDISWADPLKAKYYVAHLSSVCSDISHLIALYQFCETH